MAASSTRAAGAEAPIADVQVLMKVGGLTQATPAQSCSQD
jgi:hypothetical protein